MRFSKYHALGNDYLVLDPKDAAELPVDKDVITICHRNFGLGSDGILYGPLSTENADFGLRIINPDASEAEKSGNGLRIFSRYLRDVGLVGTNSFTVETPGGIVTCVVNKDASSITVDMGRVSFDASVIPVNNFEGEVLDKNIVLNGTGKNIQGYVVLLGVDHIHGQKHRSGGVDGHGGGDLVQRDLLEKNLHILQRIYCHAGFANFAF